MKRYLNPTTRPWTRKIERRHKPRGKKYSSFKSCLRWEFGFFCAFCQLHEKDLKLSGVEGWSLVQIEHSIPQSEAESKRDVYENCLLICERCNKSRRASPNFDEAGSPLLDPCAVVWSNHFERVEDELRPILEDKGAEYTWHCYDLDDPRKVILRTMRRTWMEKCAERIAVLADLESRVGDQAVDLADSALRSELLKSIDLARELRATKRVFCDKLDEYSPLPEDRGSRCGCRNAKYHSLAEVFAEQTVDLADLLAEAKAHKN